MKEQLENILYLHRGNIKAAANDINEYFNTLSEVSQQAINWIRAKVQEEALQAWINAGHKGLIAMATGTGKSKIVVNYSMNYDSTGITIIVPTEKLRDENWNREYIKFGSVEVYEQIYKQCYASIKNDKNQHYRLAVLDEGHNVTEGNSIFFEQNNIQRIMCLTATPPTDPIKVAILERLGVKTVYELDLDTAVKLRIVAPYEIIIVETSLESITKSVKAGPAKKPFFITEKAKYTSLSNFVNKLMYGNVPNKQNLLKIAILSRMKFLYGLTSKKWAAEYILKHLIPETNRTLIFCGSIDQAKEICPNTYHSKTTDVDLNKFINKEVNKLSCVNALNEGMNIPEVDDAIIIQLNSNEKDLIQRLGRCVRQRNGHKARIFVIVCKDTVDEKWLTSAIENLDSNNIKRVKLSDLKVNNDSI